MKSLHIITPVKDSIELTLKTAEAVMQTEISVPFDYTIYNDFSTPENTQRLMLAADALGFHLVNLSDVTDHPSPNYLLVLQMARERALASDAALLIVESDVVVKPDTAAKLFEGALHQERCGLAAAITVDDKDKVNYPYQYAADRTDDVRPETKHLSFCCTLFTPPLMRAFDFNALDSSKNWFDVMISHRSLKLGFVNYLFSSVRVLHRPHGSRPWKLLKYSNPLKYYWMKFTKGRDKI